MSYLHINNLYKAEGQRILLFKECYALEKLHGTSAHIKFKTNPSNKAQWQLVLFSGGEKYNNFIALFDDDALMAKFLTLSPEPDKEYTIYGEAYGGSQQGMSLTYGPKLKFGVFDVQIGESWLDVPNGEKFANDFGLEFVPWTKVSTDLAALDAERDAPSVQAIRNGVSMIVPEGADFDCPAGTKVEPYGKFGDRIANPRKREGVVLRPLIEVRLNNGDRVIAKHKGVEFQETATPRPVVDPSKMIVLDEANAIAEEWVVKERLLHVLDKIEGERDMKLIPKLLPAMQEDVRRESKGEVIWSDAVAKAIGKKAVELYKAYLNSKIC